MSKHILSEIRGEMSTEPVPCMHVEWKVPYNLLLCQETDSRIHSPSFHFKGVSWYLRLKTYAQKCTPFGSKHDPIDIYLVKSDVDILTSLNYHIGIKTAGKRVNLQDVGEDSSHFEVDLDCWGQTDFFRRRHLFDENTSLTGNGVVTFFCYFWLEVAASLSPVTRKKLCSDQSRITSSQLLSENSGEISTEVITVMYVECKFWDIHLPPEDNKAIIRSSHFQLQHETWYLQATMHDTKIAAEVLTTGPIDFHLVRMGCVAATFHVDYKIGIKNIDGNIHILTRSNDIIHRKLKCYRWPLHPSVEDKDIQAPNGEVTFFFWLLVESTENFDAVYKTQMTEGNDESEEECSNSEDKCSESENEYSESEEDFQEKELKDLKEKLKKYAGLEKLGNDFKNLFLSGEDSDVTIREKDKEFKAHKYILRARSTVFHSMFSHDMAEKNTGTVDIPDFDPEAFEIFLLYLYSGNMENLSTNIVFDLFRAADKYDTEELKLKCKELMVTSLSVETVCDVVEHALQYNGTDLLKTATEFFAKNFKSVILTVKWQSFMKKNTVVANELLIKASNCYVFQE